MKKNVNIERAKQKRLNIDEDIRISISRLEKDIIELGQIGRNQEDGGVYRMAFTEADMQARKWLINKIEEVDLKASMDGAANVFGLDDRAGTRSSFLIGSHLDSVPCAGVVDGPLGVLAALECMRVIKENNIELKENLELVATSDEEGRFGAMLGSQAICGEVTPEIIRTAADSSGLMLKDAMTAVGLDPQNILHASRHHDLMSGFLEIHIEQGPVLDNKSIDIGVVENISGIFKWKVELIGEANHSGTTPMDMRKDSFQGLCEFANEIPRILEENGSELSRATIGKVEIFPGSPHTVPGRTEFTLVGRDFTDSQMCELEEAFRKALSAISRRRGLMFNFEELSRILPTQCDVSMQNLIESEAKKLGVSYMRMPSGAGHDGQYFGKYMPMGMIFVPSLNGISHSPDEWTSLEHLEIGANLLLKTILRALT